MEMVPQTTLIVGLALFGVGLVIALLGRLMMSSSESAGGGLIEAIMLIFAGAGARVSGWVAMGLGAVVSVVAVGIHMFGG